MQAERARAGVAGGRTRGEDVLRGLEALGHRLDRVGPLEGPCSVQAIRDAAC